MGFANFSASQAMLTYTCLSREVAEIAHHTNHGVFSVHFFAMTFVWYQDSISSKITQFGAVDGQIWRCGCEK